MKNVLISIRPKYVELIVSGKKTVEVRRTRPKCELPFKCYIYETQGRTETPWVDEEGHYIFKGRGKVIGEFVCDRIYDITPTSPHKYDCGWNVYEEHSRLTFDEFRNYLREKNGYGWHITDLVVYDKPRELSEFYTEGDCDCMNCKKCYWFDRGNGYNVENDCNLAYKCVELHKSLKPIIRPPQSWCYIEPRQTAE